MKTVFVGCGNIAHVHMKFLKKNGLSVAAVCDMSLVRAEDFATNYQIPSFYSDIEEMLNDEKPDIVHLLTPPQTHYNLIVNLLNSGCHVLVEKPFCQTSDEYQSLIQLAKEKKLILSVDHTRVYAPMVVKAREHVLSGQYGELVRVEYDYDDPSLIKDDSVQNGYKWARGIPAWFSQLRGGLLADLLPHPLSVFLTFDEQLKIDHVYTDKLTDNIPVNLTVLLSSPTSHAVAKLSLASKPLKNQVMIYCDQGSIKLDLRNMYSVYLPNRQMPNIVARVINTMSESWQQFSGFSFSVVKVLLGKKNPYDGMELVFRDFYSHVQNNDLSALPLINSERVMGLTEKILSSAVPRWQSEPVDPTEKYAKRIRQAADILVVGGTGFIGRALVDKLQQQGHKIRVLCRSVASVPNLPVNVGLSFGDVRNKDSLSRSLDGVNQVYYCAAAMAGDWAEFYESTVGGTKNLLETLENSNVVKLIYVSSLGIIDYNVLNNGDIINEESTLERNPTDRGGYTRSKKEAEDLVRDFASNQDIVNTVIIRPGLVYGKGSNNNLSNAGVLIGKFLFVFGMGNRYLGLSYVENVVDSMIKAAEVNLNSGQVFHVVETEQPTVRRIIKLHNKYANNRVFPIYIPIFIWKTVFFIVDKLLTLKNKKRSTFGYRFASNSKKLNYENELLVSLLDRHSSVDVDESFKKTYS